MTRYNAHEALQLLEDEGFFSHADIAIQPPGDGLESEEDSGDEADNDPNHLSGNQLLANAEIHIDYGDNSTFGTIDDQMDKKCDESEEEPKQPDVHLQPRHQQEQQQQEVHLIKLLPVVMRTLKMKKFPH